MEVAVVEELVVGAPGALSGRGEAYIIRTSPQAGVVSDTDSPVDVFPTMEVYSVVEPTSGAGVVGFGSRLASGHTQRRLGSTVPSMWEDVLVGAPFSDRGGEVLSGKVFLTESLAGFSCSPDEANGYWALSAGQSPVLRVCSALDDSYTIVLFLDDVPVSIVDGDGEPCETELTVDTDSMSVVGEGVIPAGAVLRLPGPWVCHGSTSGTLLYPSVPATEFTAYLREANGSDTDTDEPPRGVKYSMPVSVGHSVTGMSESLVVTMDVSGWPLGSIGLDASCNFEPLNFAEKVAPLCEN